MAPAEPDARDSRPEERGSMTVRAAPTERSLLDGDELAGPTDATTFGGVAASDGGQVPAVPAEVERPGTGGLPGEASAGVEALARQGAQTSRPDRVRSDDIITDLVGELDTPPSDLWLRIRKGFGVADLDDPLVRKWELWYSERADYVARMIDRSRRYLYHVVNEVEERDMPLEIALLPMIESAFNPMAYSRAKASGIWQFIPSTGESFGLKQTWWTDKRRDVLAATQGALDYLQRLHGMFGDWQLALAAYNWGEGAVSRAQAANRRRGLPVDYASLQMPEETRNYVPKLQAVKNIVRNPELYKLTLGDIPNFPYFRAVALDRKIDVKLAAELAGMSLEDFLSLNPQHNRPVIAGADEQVILLPYDHADRFVSRLHLHRQPLVSWQAYRMRRGETVRSVAATFGLSVESLRTVNGIGARTRVPPGHVLLVPVQQPSFEAAATLQHAVFRTVPPSPTLDYRVRKGETLHAVARRHGVSVDELRQWNRLASDRIRVGQRLRIFGDAAERGAGSEQPALVRVTAGTKPSAKSRPVAAAPVRSSVVSTPRAKNGKRPSARVAAPSAGKGARSRVPAKAVLSRRAQGPGT
jgi:membrane-bound lytic murein transglycosylase D